MIRPLMPPWCRPVGTAVCITGLCLCALCCERKVEVPMMHPGQFSVLRIYDINTYRNPIPENSHLVEIAHVDLDKDQTQRVFEDLRYSNRPPYIVTGPRFLGIATTTKGEEYRLLITWPMAFFVIEGQPGCYHFEGDSLKEISTVMEEAMRNVFVPARRKRVPPDEPSPGT